MKKFFLTLLAAILFISPVSYVHAFAPDDDDDDEPLDQFMTTMGASGYILWQAIDLAKENHYRYLKILSAEYVLGNQAGGFTCHAEGEPTGKIFVFEDDTIKITISCYHVMPSDTDYIDVEVYKDLIQMIEDGVDEFTFGEDDTWPFDLDKWSFDDDDDNDW